MTLVLLAIKMIRSFRIPHIADTDFSGNSLQLAIIIDFACKAVQRMIGQYQFDDIFP